MFAVVLIALIVALMVFMLFAILMFVSVAFGNLEKTRKEEEKAEIRCWLEKFADLHVEPNDATSPTFGDLVRQGFFKHWTDPESRC